MKYENIDFTFTTKKYVLNVHNCTENENMLIIDYMRNNKRAVTINQMILTVKECTQILIEYFNINENDFIEYANEITKIKIANNYKL